VRRRRKRALVILKNGKEGIKVFHPRCPKSNVMSAPEGACKFSSGGKKLVEERGGGTEGIPGVMVVLLHPTQKRGFGSERMVSRKNRRFSWKPR